MSRSAWPVCALIWYITVGFTGVPPRTLGFRQQSPGVPPAQSWGSASTVLGFRQHSPGVPLEVIKLLRSTVYFNPPMQVCEQGFHTIPAHLYATPAPHISLFATAATSPAHRVPWLVKRTHVTYFYNSYKLLFYHVNLLSCHICFRNAVVSTGVPRNSRIPSAHSGGSARSYKNATIDGLF